jgi:trehalose 6-phosphate phosphatase
LIPILTHEHRVVLAEVAWSHVLLAFDFDGTLAPIVEDRDDAEMRRGTARLFARLCEAYPVAVISGRARDDVGRRLGTARPRYVIGNHGLEPGVDMRPYEAFVQAALDELAPALGGLQGVELEDKTYSLAIHYRRSRTRREARQTIQSVLESLVTPARVVEGKCVVNLVPPGAPDKGDAVRRLRAADGANVALYVGDDFTDEDVFRLDEPGRLLSIRVGESATSAVPYCLRDQLEIDEMLAFLLALRQKSIATTVEE